MAHFSIDMENKIINHFLGKTTQAFADTLYVALCTSSTGLETNATMDEVDTTDYARQVVTFGTTTLGETENAATITFATADADWGAITHIAIMDHLTNTQNVVMWGPLTATKTVNSGDTFTIPAGDLDIDVD